MGIPDHLTCLLRNLYAGQEATVRTGHGTTDWFQIRKEYAKAVYCHPAYLPYMQSTSWETLDWKKHKLGSRLMREISPYSRKWGGTKKPLDESERGEWSSVQSLSRVRLFATPWIAACQASLSIANSRSSIRLMSIKSVMPSDHLIPNPSKHQSLFQWVSSSHEVAKVLEFQL